MGVTVHDRRSAPLGFFHCTLTGAAVLGILFVLCWATSAGGQIPASRAMVGLFAEPDQSPRQALVSGLMWSLVVGGLTGGLIALCFNLLGKLSRPRPHA